MTAPTVRAVAKGRGPQGPLGGRGVLMLARARRGRLGMFPWAIMGWIANGGGFLGTWPGRLAPPRPNRRARRR